MGSWKQLTVCSLLVSILAAACAAPPSRPGSPEAGAAPQQIAPKRIVAGIRGNPKFVVSTLNSGGGGAVDGAGELGGLTSAGLAVQSGRGEWEARSAEQLPTVENGNWRVLPDGRMETVWRIREGAVWHDGTPLTAHDYAFTAVLDREPEMPWLVDRVYRFIDGVEAVDARTLKVGWKQAYIRADQLTLRPEYPRHLLEEPLTRGDKANISTLPYWTTDFVGTGAFRVREWVTDSHVVLAAFDRFFLGRPRIDELEIKFLADSNALIANILADAVDFTLGQGLSVEQGMQVKERWPQGEVTAGVTTNNSMNAQFLNPDPPILLNVQFRRALYMAIDRQQMVDEFTYGLSQVLHAQISPFEPEWPSVEPRVVRYPYDPRRGGQMIEELGFRRGSDGMFVDGTGKVLSVQIMSTQDDYNAKPQVAIADMWKRIGVTPDIEVVTPQKQRDLEYRANFRSFSVQGGVSFGADGVNAMHTREMRTAERSYVGQNYIRYSNPQLDALIDRYFTTIPFRDRVETLAEILHFATDNLLYLPLYQRVLPTLVNNRVTGITPMGQGNQWANAHLWDVQS